MARKAIRWEFVIAFRPSTKSACYFSAPRVASYEAPCAADFAFQKILTLVQSFGVLAWPGQSARGRKLSKK